MTDYQYDKEFMDALDFSLELGFDIPKNWKNVENRFLDRKLDEKITELLKEMIGGQPIKLFIRNCLGVHWQLIKRIEEIIGTTPVLTIGSFRVNEGKKRFDFSREDVNKWVNTGIENPNNVNLHAWLTLPSMEILDFTLPAAVAYLNTPKDKNIGIGVLASHWTELKGGLRYEPVAIGNDIPPKFNLPPTFIFRLH